MLALPEPVQVHSLSSDSFIDTILTVAGLPTYSVETHGASSSISRCTSKGLAHVATVRWPKSHSAGYKGKARETTTIDIGGRSLSYKEILRPLRLLCGALCPYVPPLPARLLHRADASSLRQRTQKFYAAGFPHSFKWTRSHGMWQCKSHSHDVIATLEHGDAATPMQLKIFPSPSLHPSTNPFSDLYFDIDAPSLLDSNLVDMLVLTALLLVTEPDEWRTLPCASASTSISSPVSSTFAPSICLPPSPIASSNTFESETPSLISDYSLWELESDDFTPIDPPPPYSPRSIDEPVFKRHPSVSTSTRRPSSPRRLHLHVVD